MIRVRCTILVNHATNQEGRGFETQLGRSRPWGFTHPLKRDEYQKQRNNVSVEYIGCQPYRHL
jgi:hypothetical protein